MAAEPIQTPPSPEPGYRWVDSGEELYALTHKGMKYEPKIVVGAYIPEECEIGKTYPVHIYVTRLSKDVSALDAQIQTLASTGNVFGVNLCAGIGVEVGVPRGLSWYVHFGMGFTLFGQTFWDFKPEHIPISGSFLAQSTEDFKEGSLKILPERISYERISDIPYNEWDGPFTTDITAELAPFIVPPSFIEIAGAMIQVETPAIEVQPAVPTTIQYNVDVKELTINLTVEDLAYAAVKIWQLTERPPNITAAPSGSLYRYFIINTNLEDRNVGNANIQFKVERAWIAGNRIDEQTIRLSRYNPGDEIWESLPTEKISKDDLYVHYSATSSGLSLFAVTGEVRKVTPTTLWLAVGIGVAVLLGGFAYFTMARKRLRV